MTNCLFYSLFFVLFLSTCFGSLRYSQINRSFLSIYKGMLEAALLTIDDNGEPVVPYFNKDRVANYVNTYLDENISKYSKKYTLTTDFIDITSNYCARECRNLKITLKADINEIFKYEKTQLFAVKTKEEL